MLIVIFQIQKRTTWPNNPNVECRLRCGRESAAHEYVGAEGGGILVGAHEALAVLHADSRAQLCKERQAR